MEVDTCACLIQPLLKCPLFICCTRKNLPLFFGDEKYLRQGIGLYYLLHDMGAQHHHNRIQTRDGY